MSKPNKSISDLDIILGLLINPLTVSLAIIIATIWGIYNLLT